MSADSKGRAGVGLQKALYVVFLVTCLFVSLFGILMIWGFEPSKGMIKVVATLAVMAVASAFTMSANRLVAGPPAEDDAG